MNPCDFERGVTSLCFSVVLIETSVTSYYILNRKVRFSDIQSCKELTPQNNDKSQNEQNVIKFL